MKRLINVKIILYLVFILTGCATTTVRLPNVQEEQVREMKGKEYIVQSGDSLSKLADKFYDDHYVWPAILEATNDKAKVDNSFNKIEDHEYIKVGHKLWIPDVSEIEHFLAEAEIRGDVAEHEKETAHWSYKGDVGPDSWGDLDRFFELCSEGTEQSPIDISNLWIHDVPEIKFYYSPTIMTILNNGHTVQVNYDDGSFVDIEGTRYGLVQFHFHIPSEHTFNGQFSAMEMHLVHESSNGDFAVIGVMINEGRNNDILDLVWNHLPPDEGPRKTIDININVFDLLPPEKQAYLYNGSLTTPPCSEGIIWLVMNTPIEVSKSQIKAFQYLFNSNNRPVQPLHNRKVVAGSPIK